MVARRFALSASEVTMRIATFGTGGAGGYFGGLLAKAGEDVTFIARGAHLDAIKADGLTVETPTGEFTIKPASTTDAPAEAGPVDLILLGVKAWQVPEAAEAMRPMVGPDTVIVPLQNGVEAAGQLATVLGPRPVLTGLCGTFSWVAAPGRIKNIGGASFVRFGEPDNRWSERGERVRAVLHRAGIAADIPTDIHHALWSKFLTVTAFGGIGALSRAPIGVIRALPETRALLERCIAETLAVARAHGIAMPEAAAAATLGFLDGLPEAATTSLQRDIASGRRSELDSWNGAVVRLAADKHVAVPTHEMIYNCLLPLERKAQGALAFPA
jgi:2-dehydropantoate 2-reductase